MAAASSSSSSARVSPFIKKMDLNLIPLPPNKPVTVYRVEPKNQEYQYTSITRPMWSHVHNTNNNLDAYVYQAKPLNEFRTSKTQFRFDLKMKDALKKKKGYAQGRNDIFLNFGNPYRALEFYYQKSTNEIDKEFVIRTFQIPHEIWLTLMNNAVHEDEAPSNPGRPYNVDRKAYNQLGLREKQVRLINKNIIENSSKVLDPRVLYSELTLDEKKTIQNKRIEHFWYPL